MPNDAAAVMGSRNAGMPLIQHAPKSRVQASLVNLAAALDGKTNGTVPAEVLTKRGFFSFFARPATCQTAAA